MEQQIGITEARNRIGELVDMVRYRGDTIVLVKSGKPAAAIVPVEWLEHYRKERAAAFATVTQVQAQNEDVSEEELQLLLDESIREVRKEAHRE
jgi:prevent-host-death family protein